MTTALLVIDAQASLLEAAWNADAVIERINELIAAAHLADAPVIFVRDRRVAPDPSLHPAVESQDQDLQLEKDHCDAFFGTGLREALDARRVETLVVAGLQTEYCIDTTCRRAISDGFNVVLVSDAHTTLDTELLPARAIVSHHTQVLGNLTAGVHRVFVKPAAEIAF